MQTQATGAAGLSPSEPWCRRVQVSSDTVVFDGGGGVSDRVAFTVCSFLFCVAGDISLLCVTPDVQRVICQWDASRYGEGPPYKASYTTDLE